MMIRNLKKVVCGISGGVDSAVAAHLLKKKGYEVYGLYMTNWDSVNEHGVCYADEEKKDAKFVCEHLKIPFLEANFVKEYWNDVFSDFIKEYQSGLVPNPDVLCNKHIKFGAFFKYAMNNLNADAIATGHYARTSFGDDLDSVDPAKGVKLLRAFDHWKDQTFFLSQISQEALQKSLFPLGDIPKNVVKQLAVDIGLEKIAKKKESMGICFIGKRNFASFIEEYIENKPGKFIHVETGEVIGTHLGTHHYTLGQRVPIVPIQEKCFVVEVDHKTQNILVAPGTDHPSLFSEILFTKPAHWIHRPPRELFQDQMMDVDFLFQKIDPPIPCTLTLSGGNSLIVSLSKPVRAITPGQYSVFYKGEECLGSAKILRPGPSLYTLNYKNRINKPVDT